MHAAGGQELPASIVEHIQHAGINRLGPAIHATRSLFAKRHGQPVSDEVCAEWCFGVVPSLGGVLARLSQDEASTLSDGRTIAGDILHTINDMTDRSEIVVLS